MLFTITGDCFTVLHWEEYGLRMTIQNGSLPPNKLCDVVVKALVGGQFEFPDGSVPVSAVYAISLTRKLLKPAILEIQHCVDIQNKDDCKSLQFVVAGCAQKTLPYEFTAVPGGKFYPGSQYGVTYRESFSMISTTCSPSGKLHIDTNF